MKTRSLVRYLAYLVSVPILVMFAGACAGASPAAYLSASEQTASASAVTLGQLAEGGKTVFASRCQRCHGDRGQGGIGPAIIGPDSRLQEFNTARGLYDFISTAMPRNAPGSLSRQEYEEVVSFILLKNNFVPADTVFGVPPLDGLSLKR